VRWCEAQSLTPLDPLAFATEFKDLCERGRIEVRHDGSRAYCEDVKLTA
jgi:hypothetical protein